MRCEYFCALWLTYTKVLASSKLTADGAIKRHRAVINDPRTAGGTALSALVHATACRDKATVCRDKATVI